MSENWLPVPGFEASYKVSDTGRVMSVARTAPRLDHVIRVRERELVQTTGLDGYRRVKLTIGHQEGPHVSVSRLVLLAFVGPHPEGHSCDHINRVRSDNRLENLRWASVKIQTENRGDTRVFGEKHGMSKFTETEVISMRHQRASGATLEAIAHQFSTTKSTIARITKGEGWANVGGPITKIINPRPAILELANQGMSRRAIAKQLNVSRKIVQEVFNLRAEDCDLISEAQ